jgi:hypothetical protein
MNRKDLVEKLINEGFSEKTLVGFSDFKLKMLASKIIGEAQTVATTKTVYSANDQNDKAAVNALLDKASRDPNILKDKTIEVKEAGKKPTKKLTKLDKKDDGQTDGFKQVKEWVNSLVENGYHPLTTKGDMIETITKKINESGNAPATKPAPREAPVKDPGTKEPPKRRDDPRRTPFRNPNENPKVNPNPKAETGKVVPMPNKAKKGHNGIPEFMTYDAITGNKFKMAAE